MVIFLTQTLHGRITNYRTGPKSQTSKECLIEFETVNSAALAGKLVGQKVSWKNGSGRMLGKIRGAHGKNGMVRVRFPHGVPGQAIGAIVELIG
jgi:ribosomal protein L35AE/L33A